MENYTKYKLKDEKELSALLEGKDNLFVLSCNKCFKEFETFDEPDCEALVKLAEAQGKKITGSAKIDFLCNKTLTGKAILDLIPEDTEGVLVAACGLGIQTLASLL